MTKPLLSDYSMSWNHWWDNLQDDGCLSPMRFSITSTVVHFFPNCSHLANGHTSSIWSSYCRFLKAPAACSSLTFFLKDLGAPGGLSLLSTWLQLKSWSQGSWVRAPCWALCWQLRAWSLLQILCLPLSLSTPPSLTLCLCLSQK